MRVKVLICLYLFLVAGGWSCRKMEELSPIPAIELVSFEATGNRGLLTISFTDGDGDIGLNENDDQPPFDIGSEFFTNLKLEYWEKVADAWRKSDTVHFAWRIPSLTPGGQIKSLEGTIEVALEPFYYALPSVSIADTFMYRIRLVDRALQYSNEIETEELIRP